MKQKKMAMKIGAVIGTVVLLLIFGKLMMMRLLNEGMIKKYEQGEYDEKPLEIMMWANFPEEYVAYYNLGNVYYKENKLDDALKEYQEALKTVPYDRVCDVRLNMGLTMTKTVDKESEAVNEELTKIANMLLEDGCATTEKNGRHEGAQKLYNEIMAALKETPQGGKSDDPANETPSQGESDINEKEIEERLREEAEKANMEHNNDYYYEGNELNDYEYYGGKPW